MRPAALAVAACLALRCAQGEELTANWNDPVASGGTTEPGAGGASNVGAGAATTGGAGRSATGTGDAATGVGAGGSAAGTTAGAGGFSGARGTATGTGAGGAGGFGGDAGATSGSAGAARDAGRDVGTDARGGGFAGAGSDASTCSQGCAIRVQYQNDVMPAEPMTSTVRIRIDVFATGAQGVRSNDVTIRYWFTDPGGPGDKVTCYFTQGGCSDITTRFAAVEPARRGADRYLEIAFTATTTLAPGDHTGTISLGIQHTTGGGALYDQTDDYSYSANRPALVDWPNITAYVGKTLVWGVEP